MFAEYEHVGVNAINAVIRPILITPPPVGERSIVMSMSVCVCLSVCVCVCQSAIISGKLHVRSLTIFLFMAVARPLAA